MAELLVDASSVRRMDAAINSMSRNSLHLMRGFHHYGTILQRNAMHGKRFPFSGSVPAELRCGAVRCFASCRVTELWKPRVIRHVRTRHGNTLDSIKMFQRSYSTLGPVSAWVGDRLWTGKPPRRRTRYPGLLSLSPLCVVKLE